MILDKDLPKVPSKMPSSKIGGLILLLSSLSRSLKKKMTDDKVVDDCNCKPVDDVIGDYYCKR